MSKMLSPSMSRQIRATLRRPAVFHSMCPDDGPQAPKGCCMSSIHCSCGTMSQVRLSGM